MGKVNLLSIFNIIYFIILILLFASYYYYNQHIVKQLYTTLGGRIIIVLLILFGCTIHIGVGLVVLLLVLIFKPVVVQEGLTLPRAKVIANNRNMSDDSTTNSTSTSTTGVDRIGIADSIRARPSKSLPATTSTSSDNVEPFSNFSSTLRGGNIYK